MTEGPFRYCRNPMTLGTILAYLGMAVAARTTAGTLLVLSRPASLSYLNRVPRRGSWPSPAFGERISLQAAPLTSRGFLAVGTSDAGLPRAGLRDSATAPSGVGAHSVPLADHAR